MFIYMITNLVTDKKYIGLTIRRGKLFDNYWGSGKYITNSIKKHGKENFEKEILQICFNKEELYESEKYWINKMNTIFPNGYNIHEGGHGGDSMTMKTQEEKNEIYRKRKENNPDFGFKAWETRRNNGFRFSEEFRVWARQNSYKSLHTPESKQKRLNSLRLNPPRTLKYTIQNIKTDEIVEIINGSKLNDFCKEYNDSNNYKLRDRCNYLTLIYKGKSGDFIFINKEPIHPNTTQGKI